MVKMIGLRLRDPGILAFTQPRAHLSLKMNEYY